MLFSVRTIVSQIFAVEWGRQVKIEKEEQLKSFKIPGLWVFWCFIISDYKGTGAGGSDSIAAAAVAEQCSAWEPWELRSWYLVWTLITHVTSNTGLWLADASHMITKLASDWSIQAIILASDWLRNDNIQIREMHLLSFWRFSEWNFQFFWTTLYKPIYTTQVKM